MSKEVEQPIVRFYTNIKGLIETPELHPQPANKYIPNWWKTIPKQEPFPATQTVKVCPSFPEFFSQGYVVPLWADVLLSYNDETQVYEWSAGRAGANNPFVIDIHPNDQFVNYVSPHFQGKKGNFIFKFESPWKVITSNGYSLFQLPMFYHFDSNFSVLPGILHSDTHSEINQQVVYYGEGKDIFIKRGTPLVQYIPFKRTDYKLEVGNTTEEDDERDKIAGFSLISKFLGSGAYKARALKERKEQND